MIFFFFATILIPNVWDFAHTKSELLRDTITRSNFLISYTIHVIIGFQVIHTSTQLRLQIRGGS